MLDQITPLLITYNEAPNIKRAVEKLLWAERIVVIDSGSVDGTTEILQNYPQIEIFQRPFRNFADQCNFGLTRVRSPWVLSLDADYELSKGFVAELASLAPPDSVVGYRAGFTYRIHGRPLRGSLYPHRTVLHRTHEASYRQEGHAHYVVLSGDVLTLDQVIYHDDRKPLSRWFSSQQRYAREEADYLFEPRHGPLRPADKIRLRGWPAPFVIFFFTLFLRGCLFDGWPGWYYVLQRVTAEALLSLEIIDRRLRERPPRHLN